MGSHWFQFGSGSSIFGQCGFRVLMTKKWGEKNLQQKKFLFVLSKIAIYLSLGLHKESPSYWRRLQLSKEAIQHFKTWNFLIFSTFMGHFCPPGSGSGFRILIRIHWPDWIWIQSGSGSATLQCLSPYVMELAHLRVWWKAEHAGGPDAPVDPQETPRHTHSTRADRHINN